MRGDERGKARAHVPETRAISIGGLEDDRTRRMACCSSARSPVPNKRRDIPYEQIP